MLKGERVTLRAIEESDYDRLAKFARDVEIHVIADDEPPVPRSFDQIKEDYQELQKKQNEIVVFAIEADGAVIGSCSVHRFDYTARTCALGITIGDRNFWGKGYGRDAVRLLVEYAFHHLNLRKVHLTVRSDNERAVRAYEAVGFVSEGLQRQHVWMDGAYRDWISMGLLRSEWAGPSRTT
jgi:RimJ/RimL family protein N-acetyltransferase